MLISLFTGALAAAVASLFLARKERTAIVPPRSVTAMRIKTSNPIDTMKLTGTVEAWREENLSFEVPGRIEWCIDKGSDIQGGDNPYSLTNDDGALVATLAPEEYELRLKAAEANARAAEAQLNALNINIREVISRQLEAAKADLDNAEKDYRRLKSLFEKQVISQKACDAAETDFLKKQAKYSEIKALIIVREADAKAAAATFEQLNQAVADAELDLKRTKLRSPYPGKIAEVYANIGANVKAGEKVAKLVALDPISVKLNISPELDRTLHFRQFVRVYPAAGGEPVLAMINRKSAIADSKTHTFSLELLLRNKLITVAKTIPEQILALPEISGVWPAGKINWHGEERLIALIECIQHDDEGDFIWKAEEMPESLDGAPVYELSKERTSFLPGEHNLLGVFHYRVIDDPANINEKSFMATGVPDGVETGDKLVFIRRQRMFKPGDLVKVLLTNKETAHGIYVPLKTISSDSLKHWVFKTVRRKDGSFSAERVFVTMKNRFNNWARIESPFLQDGDLIISDGASFLSHNEKVNIKAIEKSTL